jgi:hypothetical protein
MQMMYLELMKKILEPSNLREMRINSRKIRKILGRIWTEPKRIFETFYTQEAPRCIGMNATLTSNQFIFIQKIKQ